MRLAGVGCRGKKRYQAYRVADQVRQKRAKRIGRPLRIYLCYECGCWHLTSWTWDKAVAFATRKGAR